MKVKITDFDIVTHKQDSMWDRVGCSLLRKKKFFKQAKDICIGYQMYLAYY